MNRPFRADHPFWADYRGLLQSFYDEEVPTVAALNRLLPRGTTNHQKLPISFVASEQLTGVQYEEHIFRTGEVSTRANSWHDVFNVLVWMHFPQTKAAMNVLHHRAMTPANEVGRGTLRDALTLIDECGVIVAAGRYEDLESVSRFAWAHIFGSGTKWWGQRIRVFVTGHAMLEKFLKPYKSITANAVLVQIPGRLMELLREALRAYFDAALAERLLAGHLFNAPADLSPLPLMGIPGWWPGGAQDKSFYADRQVFRQPVAGFRPAPIFSLQEPVGADNSGML